MGYELQKLSAQHKRIVSLTLEGRYNKKQIASIMGMTEAAIGYITNCGAFQDELARRRMQIEAVENEDIANNLSLTREVLGREALHSAMKLAEVRDGTPDMNLQRQASVDILKLAYATEDMGGGGKNGSGPMIGTVVVMEGAQVAFMNQVAKEAGVGTADDEKKPDDGGTPPAALAG